MADIVRHVELWDLEPASFSPSGGVRTADLGKNHVRVGAYIDTGAGRTVCTESLVRRIKCIEVPGQKIRYTVPIVAEARAVLMAIRLCEDGCQKPVPVLVAVSDAVVGALDIRGLEILLGQDVLQIARVSLHLAPKGRTRVSCRQE